MVKFEINWSIKAKNDLFEILLFYKKRNGNSIYSRKIKNQINRSTNQISINPNIGIETQIENVRYYITMDYEIIYKIFNDKIRIIMIWSSKMEPKKREIERRLL
jgi:plasmid stabilization system protein ParE